MVRPKAEKPATATTVNGLPEIVPATKPNDPDASKNTGETQTETAASFGAWTVASLDAVRKRALCVCRCGTTALLSYPALVSGLTTGCGCRQTPTIVQATADGRRAATFAADLAAAEGRGAWKRHKGGGGS